MISGGAGKVICAIPALEKFARLNPDNDFRVVIPAWDSLYWGNPILQSRTFNVDHKGLFDHVVKNNRLVVSEVGHPHAMGDWDWSGPRITIAYDVQPLDVLISAGKTIPEQHWFPLL